MMSKCREAFERNEAKKCNVSYEELKTNFDTNEKFLGERYPSTSPRHDAWLIWEAAWQQSQTEVNVLQKRVDVAYIKLAMLRQTELWREDDIFELFEELEQTLKGGSDE